MNIAIINECKTLGGCEVFVQRLRDILSNKGNNVFCIYLKEVDGNISENEYSLMIKPSGFKKYIYSPSKAKEIRKILSYNKIEVIILNNIFSEPITLYKSIEGYKIVQILHDYSVICPKSTCIKDDGDVCRGYKKEKCIKSCTYHGSKSQLILKLFLMSCIDMIRKKKYKFIAPSKRLTQYAINNGYKVKTLENPINISLNIKEKNPKKDKYVYIGGLNKNKGLYELLPAFKKFSENRNVKLYMYGRTSSVDDELILGKYCSDKIIYMGYVNHDEIADILEDTYALLVPSFWMENYPTTVLEGFANNVLVIGSDRGGIPELLSDGRGICYRYGQKELVEALEKSELLTIEEYKNITSLGLDYIKNNNTLEKYYQGIIDVMKM